MSEGYLPPIFLERMQALLGDEYPRFLDSYQESRKAGLRVNTLKAAPETFEKISPFRSEKIPWIRGGYYIRPEDGASRHPFYYAGLYYLQEPSAMTPASVLDVQPGDRVLDLCAAPGGKATALGAKLCGEGLLVANDISASRCRALLKNIEVFGIPNAVITNEVPARLSEHFPAYFDRVLVDAPCSGEGMFRKDEAVARAWYPEKNEECARIQKDIIVRAADVLREGGQMLYSTCTFSPKENEEVIAHLLRTRPEMKLMPVSGYEGFSGGMCEDGALGEQQSSMCVRIWPHRMEGEGHFLALLCKGDAAGESGNGYGRGKRSLPPAGSAAGRREDRKRAEQIRLFYGFLEEMDIPAEKYSRERLYFRKDQLFLGAAPEEELKGITCIRNGLLLGEMKKDRFEPSQAMAMTLTGLPGEHCVTFSSEDGSVVKYLKGESLNLSERQCGGNGWKLVTVDGFALGWAKQTGMILKNKYLAGWRMQ